MDSKDFRAEPSKGSGLADAVRDQDYASRMTYALMDILLDMVGGVLVLTEQEWADAMSKVGDKQIDYTLNQATRSVTFKRKDLPQ